MPHTPRSPLWGMAAVAAAVVAIDFTSKRAAAMAASGGDLAVGGVRLASVHNDLLLGGLSLGAATRSVNCLMIGALVALMTMVARDLAAVDPAAPRMLGLLAGAALGNAIDLLAPGAGALDFIAIDRGDGTEIAFNLADVAFLAGLALCARTAWRVLLAWQAQREGVLAPAQLRLHRPADAEVARPIHADGVRARRPRMVRVGRGDRERIVGDLPAAPPEAQP